MLDNQMIQKCILWQWHNKRHITIITLRSQTKTPEVLLSLFITPSSILSPTLSFSIIYITNILEIIILHTVYIWYKALCSHIHTHSTLYLFTFLPLGLSLYQYPILCSLAVSDIIILCCVFSVCVKSQVLLWGTLFLGGYQASSLPYLIWRWM